MRAGKLVRQLLTFSRKQFVQMSRMDIGDTLSTISDMLPRVLSEDIAVTINVAPGLPQIHADAGMIEQMLMNLAVNARDAMADGGRLTINAELAEVSPDQADNNPDARPGRFLCLSVADTGCGMTPDVLAHIFEPFFTTKPVGKGTGWVWLWFMESPNSIKPGWRSRASPAKVPASGYSFPSAPLKPRLIPSRRRQSPCAGAARPFSWWRMKRRCAT